MVLSNFLKKKLILVSSSSLLCTFSFLFCDPNQRGHSLCVAIFWFLLLCSALDPALRMARRTTPAFPFLFLGICLPGSNILRIVENREGIGIEITICLPGCSVRVSSACHVRVLLCTVHIGSHSDSPLIYTL